MDRRRTNQPKLPGFTNLRKALALTRGTETDLLWMRVGNHPNITKPPQNGSDQKKRDTKPISYRHRVLPCTHRVGQPREPTRLPWRLHAAHASFPAKLSIARCSDSEPRPRTKNSVTKQTAHHRCQLSHLRRNTPTGATFGKQCNPVSSGGPVSSRRPISSRRLQP